MAPPFLRSGADPDHPIGTDMLGRDLAASLQGARVPLPIGVVATVITLGIGPGAGALAGFSRGRLDQAMLPVRPPRGQRMLEWRGPERITSTSRRIKQYKSIDLHLSPILSSRQSAGRLVHGPEED